MADWFGWFRKKPKRRASRNPGYAAAENSRLTASLLQESEYINRTLRYQLRALRARSRQLCQNNPYGKRFAQMVVSNVCGPNPFRMQAKVKTARGKLDDRANKIIEAAWKSWSRKGEADITGRFSWNALQRLIVRTLAVDGECLFRVYRGPDYGKHGFQVQIIDTDRLDEGKNEKLRSGGSINMGIEYDVIGRPVAYHLLKRKPSQWDREYVKEYERIPASEIYHLFVPEFAEQGRGVPWMYAVLLELVHIGAFTEAAVIAARVGASQMGVIESPDGGGDYEGDSMDAVGNPQIEAEPGQFPMLPPGYKLTGWNPKYPDAAIGPFLKACLQGMSVGLGVAHHNLSGDMEGVTYSSARIAELNERALWTEIQNFVIEHLHEPMQPDWLRMQIVLGQVKLDMAGFDRYREAHWQGKRWAWVDPQKEVAANVEAIKNKLKSRTRVIAEQGEDVEDVFTELAAEDELAKDKGLKLAEPAAKPNGETTNDEENGETESD